MSEDHFQQPTPSASAEADAAPPGRGSGPLLRVATLLLVGLAALALVAVVAEVAWLRPRHAEVTQQREDRAEVTAAAQRFMVAWNTYSPEDLDEYKSRISPMLTTKFRSEFESQFDDVATLVREGEMHSEGQVLKTAVASLDPDSALVLVVADASVETSFDNRQRHFRWEIDLAKVKGTWLVDDWRPVASTETGATP